MADKLGEGGKREEINILGTLGFLGRMISVCGGTCVHVKLIAAYFLGKKIALVSSGIGSILSCRSDCLTIKKFPNCR